MKTEMLSLPYPLLCLILGWGLSIGLLAVWFWYLFWPDIFHRVLLNNQYAWTRLGFDITLFLLAIGLVIAGLRVLRKSLAGLIEGSAFSLRKNATVALIFLCLFLGGFGMATAWRDIVLTFRIIQFLY